MTTITTTQEPQQHMPSALPGKDHQPTYRDDGERQQHRQHIEAMAAELHRSVQEVAACYEEALRRLLVQARIRDYLPVLVAKRVKSELAVQAKQDANDK